MANILDKIAAIRATILGKDVRENIASGIEAINLEVIDTTSRQTTLESDMATAKEDAIQATADANIATEEANTARDNANSKATLADTKATLADQKAILANDKATLAQTATDNANTAVTNINNNTLLIYKPWVANFAAIATTYSAPSLGWTTQTIDTHTRYRWNGTAWINIGVYADDKTGDMGQIPETNLVQAVLNDRSQLADIVQQELPLKANITDVNTAIANMGSASPKGVYATLSALQTAFPTGTTGIYVVTADGKWYYWNSSAWTIGGTYQSTEIAPKSVGLLKLGDVSSAYNGYLVNGKVGDTSVYIELIFDLQDIQASITTSDKYRTIFNYIADDANLSQVGCKLFVNNSNVAGTISGGLLLTSGNFVNPTFNDEILYDVIRENYATGYRYVHMTITLNLTNPSQLTPFKFRNAKLFVGSHEVSYTGQMALILKHVDSTLQPLEYLGNELALKSAVDALIGNTYGKWYGKKANFIGDSITYGAWNNGTTWVQVKAWHQYLKDLLGLSVARNYGVNGTHISGSYTNDGSESNPSQNFITRYTAMDNDADLIVVLGGTNDFGHTATAPFGTMADRTDISFYGGLHVLMNGLINKYLGKTIVFMTPLHRIGEDTLNTKGKALKDYANAIKEVAQYYGIQVIDTYAISGLQPNITILKTTYQDDGLHPNVLGHQYLGNRLVGAFNSL